MSTGATNTALRDSTGRIVLVACSILHKEVQWLIDHNDWPVDIVLVDSFLHCDLGKLERTLKSALGENAHRDLVVFFGACHPLMDNFLREARTFRTAGQNCIEMLVGEEIFARELRQRAFFLLEDWALRWEQVLAESFGTTKVDVIREIVRDEINYLLCLKTPCSGDFTAEAEAAARLVDLPLRWMDVSLDHLEGVLRTTIERKLMEQPCLN